MRIVYVGPLPPLRGGIAQHGARLLEAISAEGHGVEAYSWAAQYPRLLYPGNEQDASADPFSGARFDLRWWSPVSWFRPGKAARIVDLLLFPWVTPIQAPAYLTILRAAAPTPSVAIVHNPLPHERRKFDVALTKRTFRRTAGALVHARSAARDLRSLAPNLEIVSSPHPPNLSLRPTPLPPGPPYRLLFLGFIRPYKGLDVALEALALLVARGLKVQMTVAGEFWGPVKPWERIVRDRGLKDYVRLQPGYVSDLGVERLLASHHVVVLAYRKATQSGLVPLAYAAGRPVATTTVGGLPEVVREGMGGALAPPGDPYAFADAVQRVLADLPAMAKRAAANAITWADVASEVVELGVRLGGKP